MGRRLQRVAARNAATAHHRSSPRRSPVLATKTCAISPETSNARELDKRTSCSMNETSGAKRPTL